MAASFGALRAMALAMCRRCGIPPQDLEDAAAEVVQRIWQRPAQRQYAEAVETVRRLLAGHLGVPRRSLPGNLNDLKAIGEYTDVERRYASAERDDGQPWRASFDLHSKRFAIENGVCPRCARPGRFTEDAGRCDCGFAYE